MSVKEVLHGALLKGPLLAEVGAADSFAGITAMGSASTSVTVSTTVVKSDSIIIPTIQSLTNTSSGFGPNIEVRTIVDGGYFILGYSDGKAIDRNINIHWVLMNTKA